MTVEEIQKRVDAMSAAMLTKALAQPSARFGIESNAEFTVTFAWHSRGKNWAHKHEFFRGSLAKVLDEADAWIAARPSPEEKRMQDFMLSLSETIELGKKIDTEVDFVNPLVVLMERLSKNALTHAGA